MALWYTLSVLLECPQTFEWQLLVRVDSGDYDLVTEQIAASVVLSVCVKHSAFIMLSFKISIKPIHAINVSFYFPSALFFFNCSHARSLLFWLIHFCKYVHYHFICHQTCTTCPWCFCFSKVNAKISLCWFHLYISFKKVLHNKDVE